MYNIVFFTGSKNYFHVCSDQVILILLRCVCRNFVSDVPRDDAVDLLELLPPLELVHGAVEPKGLGQLHEGLRRDHGLKK